MSRNKQLEENPWGKINSPFGGILGQINNDFIYLVKNFFLLKFTLEKWVGVFYQIYMQSILIWLLTLPMLRLLSSRAKRRKDFWKTLKPCHVGIHWMTLSLRTFRWVPICQGFNVFQKSLRLFAQRRKDFWKTLKPYHVGIHWITFSLRTLRWVPICQGFNCFTVFFASFCIGQGSQQQHEG